MNTRSRERDENLTPSGDELVHVLLVDNDEALGETTAERLERTNPSLRVERVTSGALALETLDSLDAFDCIVSNYELTDMNGLDLLSAVREVRAGLPFILYTDHGSESVASEAISTGVTDYVRKTGESDITVLLARIEAAVARRRVEAERDRRALALETLSEGIAIVGDDGTYVEVNEAYADLYGYDRESLIGQSWQVVNPQEENERMYLQILPELRENGYWRGESVGLRADGSTFPKAKSMTRLDDGGFVCAIRDVTEQKRVEHHLREQNERLREFARLVSHDLRNPLNVAEGYLTLLDEEVDEAHRAHLEPIQNAHERMRRLIDDMLHLAREGRVVDSPTPVDVADVVEQSASTAGFGSAGELVVEDGLPTVLADEERLSALLENLFGNALAHAGPDPVVRVGRLEDGFFVEDDGPGIPEGERVRVFESGYTTDREGTGFGLAIVKRIADAHGWTVSIRDAERGGTRFEIRGPTLVTDESTPGAVTDGGGGADSGEVEPDSDDTE